MPVYAENFNKGPKHDDTETFKRNLETSLKKEIFKYINETLEKNLKELQRQIVERFKDLEDELFDKVPGDVIFRDESDESDDEPNFKENNYNVEHHYIGDDFNLDEFVDDIFKDENECKATHEKSMSSRDMQRAYIL